MFGTRRTQVVQLLMPLVEKGFVCVSDDNVEGDDGPGFIPQPAHASGVSSWVVLGQQWTDQQLDRQAQYVVACALANSATDATSPSVRPHCWAFA